MSNLTNNTAELNKILAAVNALPEAGSGGVNPTGTIEITENGTHDVTNYATAEVNVPSENLDAEISEQAAKIDQLLTILDSKAAGGGVSNAEVPWLTREVTEYSNPTLTKLGSYALSGTQVTSLNLPELTTIAGYSFRECMALASMVFPKLTEVPYNGCREWKGLVKADFHALKSIGSNGFYQCSNLETLIIRTPTMCTLTSGSVLTASKIEAMTGGIYVPKTLADGSNGVATYQAASNWSKYASIIYAIEDYPEITGG